LKKDSAHAHHARINGNTRAPPDFRCRFCALAGQTARTPRRQVHPCGTLPSKGPYRYPGATGRTAGTQPHGLHARWQACSTCVSTGTERQKLHRGQTAGTRRARNIKRWRRRCGRRNALRSSTGTSSNKRRRSPPPRSPSSHLELTPVARRPTRSTDPAVAIEALKHAARSGGVIPTPTHRYSLARASSSHCDSTCMNPESMYVALGMYGASPGKSTEGVSVRVVLQATLEVSLPARQEDQVRERRHKKL
jgi:hypothetical protein